MNYEFSRRNKERCESPKGFNHKMNDWSASDWFTAIMGELGEAANIQKKLNRVRDGIPGNKETELELKTNLAKELADVYIYLDILCQSQGIDLYRSVLAKFDETFKKIGYVEGVSL